MDTSAFMWKKLDDYCTTKHSPDNVHICVSITHVQPQQGRDVIRWRGWTHIPSNDVYPVGKECYVIPLMDTHLQHTSASQPTESECRTLVWIAVMIKMMKSFLLISDHYSSEFILLTSCHRDKFVIYMLIKTCKNDHIAICVVILINVHRKLKCRRHINIMWKHQTLQTWAAINTINYDIYLTVLIQTKVV